MTGAENSAAKVKEDDEASDAGSEDLEAESSGSEDEEDEEDGGEGEGDEDMEMADGEEKAADTTNSEPKSMSEQGHSQVMVH